MCRNVHTNRVPIRTVHMYSETSTGPENDVLAYLPAIDICMEIVLVVGYDRVG